MGSAFKHNRVCFFAPVYIYKSEPRISLKYDSDLPLRPGGPLEIADSSCITSRCCRRVNGFEVSVLLRPENVVEVPYFVENCPA